jgi:hypothetical protein
MVLLFSPKTGIKRVMTMKRIEDFTVDFVGIGRLVVIILCLLATRGTPLFLFALYFLLKEIKLWIRWKV